MNNVCPNCHSKHYVSVPSYEKCYDCGLYYNYWGSGPNEIYQNMLDRMEFTKIMNEIDRTIQNDRDHREGKL